MANKNVLEMLKRPVNKPASPNPEQSGGLVSELQKLIAQGGLIAEFQKHIDSKDATIRSMQETIDLLTRQGASPRENVSLPDFVLEVSGHDANGRIRTVTAKPRRA